MDGLPPGGPRAARRSSRAGASAPPRQVHADLGFVVDAGPHDRLLDPALGAGALLDMGIYPLTFAHLLLGEAEELRGRRDLAEAGIDLDVAIAGRYAGGATAALTASMTSLVLARRRDRDRPSAASTLPRRLPPPGVRRRGRRRRRRAPRADRAATSRCSAAGYGNEIAEVQRCLRAGLRESPLVPHAQTLTLMRQMDDVRAPDRGAVRRRRAEPARDRPARVEAVACRQAPPTSSSSPTGCPSTG